MPFDARVKRGLHILLVLLSIGPIGAWCEQPVSELEGLVRQWIGLRGEIAEEKRSWKAQQVHWQTEIDLLQREKQQLEAEIASAGNAEQSAQADVSRLVTQRDGFRNQLKALPPVLDRAEAELRKWEGQIPDSLRAELDRAFRSLPRTQREANALSVSRRLQLVLALTAQIERLQREVHVSRELLELGEGDRREMDVLYLGLARGFAVSRDNSTAALGTPGAEGWTWTPQSGDAVVRFREALRVANRSVPAQLVELPLQVVEGK